MKTGTTQHARPKSWQPLVPVALALAAILGLGLLQGVWSFRWGDAGAEAASIAPRLQKVPLEIGSWEGQPQEADQRQLEGAGAVGHISRTYRNRQSGDHVSLLIVCGHSRDISVHTPDRCYPAAGFAQLEEPGQQSMEFDGGRAAFFVSTFSKTGPDGTQRVRVYWTWGHGGNWLAPDWPRETFGGVGALYKMYLITPVAQEEDRHKSPCAELAEQLLPELNRVLFD